MSKCIRAFTSPYLFFLGCSQREQGLYQNSADDALGTVVTDVQSWTFRVINHFTSWSLETNL